MTDPRGATIHDLGYQRYDGPVVGERGAWMAIYVQGLRGLFGLGRAAKSKAVPVFVLGFGLIQAFAQVALAGASSGRSPVRYTIAYQGTLILYVLFAAAQGPELLSRDQQHKLLPLIFTRSVTRMGYAAARFASLVSAMFLIVMAPMLLMYFGKLGLASDPAKAFSTSGSDIFPALAVSALTAFLLSGVSGIISALTPRRAYATAGIIAFFLVLTAIGSGIDDLAGISRRSAELIDPVRSLSVLSMILFSEPNAGFEVRPPLDVQVYVAYALGLATLGAALLFVRIRRLSV